MSALARLLTDFGAPQERPAVVSFPEIAPRAPANAMTRQEALAIARQDALLAARAEAVSAQEALAAARAEGFVEGRAAARAEAEVQRLDREAEHDAALAAALAQARSEWAQAEGAALADRLVTALDLLRDEIEEGVAAVLRPLARMSAAREAARLMAGEIARLLAVAAQEAPIEIAGPADLLAALREALERDPRVGPGAERGGKVRFVEAEGVDAVARLGRAEIETRLAAFERTLEQAE